MIAIFADLHLFDFVLGNLVPMLINSAVGKFEPVQFVGQFLAVVLPVLENLTSSRRSLEVCRSRLAI